MNLAPQTQIKDLPIPDYFHTHELRHRHGGNGIYFLKPAEPGYCLAMVSAKKSYESVAKVCIELLEKFTVEKKGIEVDFPIQSHCLNKKNEILNGLADGSLVMLHGWLLPNEASKA